MVLFERMFMATPIAANDRIGKRNRGTRRMEQVVRGPLCEPQAGFAIRTAGTGSRLCVNSREA